MYACPLTRNPAKPDTLTPVAPIDPQLFAPSMRSGAGVVESGPAPGCGLTVAVSVKV